MKDEGIGYYENRAVWCMVRGYLGCHVLIERIYLTCRKFEQRISTHS